MDETEKKYREKHVLLKHKYQSTDLANCKLRNRIYHVKKEIKYLKRLKRMLIQRLFSYNDRFMEVCLEIPDSEPGSNVEDQIIAEVAQLVASGSQRSSPAPQGNSKKRRPPHPQPPPNNSEQTSQNQASTPAPPPPKKNRPSAVSSEARRKSGGGGTPVQPPPLLPPVPLPLPPVQQQEAPAVPSSSSSSTPTAADIKHLSDATKASILSIITSVVDEYKAERTLAKAMEASSTSGGEPPVQAPPPPVVPVSPVLSGLGPVPVPENPYDECFLTEDEKRALESMNSAPSTQLI